MLSWLDDHIERGLLAGVRALPDPGVLLLASLLYGGIGLALPLALSWSTLYLVVANIVGTSLSATVILVWLTVVAQASERRHLVEWTTSLRLLTAQEFEWLVGEVFRREGWEVKETGRQGAPDGNIDLELRRDGRRVIVQCKRWSAQLVGVDEIRKFGGTLLREGLGGRDGVFVTLSDYQEQARGEAAKIGMTILDNRDLFARVESVRRGEPCPRCREPMRLGRSDYGWWLRCVATGCQGKRDLGADPGRAVELLFDPAAGAHRTEGA